MERSSQSRNPASPQGDRPARTEQAFARRIDCGSTPPRREPADASAPGARGSGSRRAPGEGA